MSRVRYHLTPPSNWMNDPNGPILVDGRYHVFYQYNPTAPVWGPPHWGHVSSTDLLHWDEHPVALSPRPGTHDEDGCWSGCARVVDGRPMLFYTGVVGFDADRIEAVCRATGSADLSTWCVDPQPLIAGPPDGQPLTGHRDPFLYRDGDRWRLLLGSGHVGPEGPVGTVLLYESEDLEDWVYLGVFADASGWKTDLETGALWECPQLLRFAGGDVLIVSVQLPGEPHPLRHVLYAVGAVADQRFVARHVGLFDHGNVLYAPALLEGADRAVIWGWVQEAVPAPDRGASTAGALSLPRIAELEGDRLRVRPADELAALAGPPRPDVPTSLPAGGAFSIADPGPWFELRLRIDGNAGQVVIDLHDDVSSAYAIVVDLDRRQVLVSTRADAPGVPPQPVPLAEEDTLQLFVDATIMELFVGSGSAATTRCYERPDRLLTVRSTGGARVTSLRLSPIEHGV
ncbi:glycoside hydrolase family 32 protein [Nitriliruptor alkaliphilus]|uniref:glycoside hydrolase family 32 protein n=1 Tax=Nitriliruptor alkaliphilus TaxID=427918 RepID=UPI000696F41C|nr:glycoside hydrolase family 32 protein [Nitriliruptor alkaliphilus]